MKKKRKKNNKNILIDLRGRTNIKIIHSKRSSVTDADMDDFEKNLLNKFNDYVTFTNDCILKNMEVNRHISISSEQMFIEAMQSMLEQNKLLNDMIKNKEQENL